MWVPAKVVPDKKARGWKPRSGWYCYNITTLTADLSERHATKKAADKACKLRGGR